jgi:hypothetical protein
MFMAWWPVREKRVPVVIVDLLAKATRRLVRREIRQAPWAEPAALSLAAEERLVPATLRWALFALPA